MSDTKFLTEMFDLGSAKGYDFTISQPGEYPADPAIKFQAVFTAGNNVEYAFRAYRADGMPGRKYGPHARLLSFMRKKSRNFSQNITVDAGSFKKVLVTFLKCYAAYRETKDGQKASSYAVIMQDSLRDYASLFVRATRRAFRGNQRLHLSLYGVNETGKGNTLELMYVNPQSMYPYFGGSEFDEAAFVGNSTHVELSKFEGKEIKPAGVIAGATAPVVSAPATPDPAPVVTKADFYNPDAVPGLNDPANFNDVFVVEAFTAQGRDALEAVFKKHKIHRRYFAHQIKRAIEIWKDNESMRYFRRIDIDAINAGIGFYLKRSAPEYYIPFMTYVLASARPVDLGIAYNYVVQEKLGDKVNADYKSYAVLLAEDFVQNNFTPVNPALMVQYAMLKTVLTAFGEQLSSRDLINDLKDDDLFIARVLMNAMDEDVVSNSFFEGPNLNGNKYFVNGDILLKIKNAFKVTGIKPSFEFMEPIVTTGSGTHNALFADIINGNFREAYKKLNDDYQLDVRSDATYAAVQDLKKSIVETTAITSKMILYMYGSIQQNYYSRETIAKNLHDIVFAYIEARGLSPEDAKIIADTRADFTEELNDLVADELTKTRESFFTVIGIVLQATDHNRMVTDTMLNMIMSKAKEKGYLTSANVIHIVEMMDQSNTPWNGSRYTTPIARISVQLGRGQTSLSFEALSAIYDKLVKTNKLEFSNFPALMNNNTDSDATEKMFTTLIAQAPTHAKRITTNLVSTSPANIAAIYKSIADHEANDSFPIITKEELRAPLARAALTGDFKTIEDKVGADNIDDAMRRSPDILRVLANSNKTVSDDVPDRIVNIIVDAIHSSGIDRRIRTNDPYNSVAQQMADWIAPIDHKLLDKLTDESVNKYIDFYSKIDATSTTKRSIYQPVLDRMGDMLSEADMSKHQNLPQRLLDACSDRERRFVVKSIGKNFFFNRYIKEFRDNSAIKMNINLDQKSVAGILNFNNISLKTLPAITEKDNIETVKKKIQKIDISVPTEKIEKEELTQQQLDDLTIEYDAFNRKKHDLSLVIEESFKVSIPRQVEERAIWDKKLADEGVQSKIMSPVFHGTGSVAAAMILRLGFAVADLNTTAKTGVKTAGRMLGDGIYFSTAIDKVAQYASDGGFGRAMNQSGYIFEMNASLGKHRRDYREAGTGTQQSEKNTISPEWAVFTPNAQLMINKAYKIRRVPHHVIDNMKKARKLTNESTNVTAIRGFRDVIREKMDYGTTKMITFIFGDGTIPVGNGVLVDFDDYAGELGSNVRVEGGQLGAMVTFLNVNTDPDNIEDTFFIAMTGSFISGEDDNLWKYYQALIAR